MFQRRVNEWGGPPILSTVDGVAPAAGNGTAVTPAQNTYGTAVTLISGANLTYDCCELTINVNSIGITTTSRNGVVGIVTDPSGGTTFGSPIVDLVCGPAHAYAANGNSGGGGVWFRFPLWIKSGTTIGAVAAVNSATLTAVRVSAMVRGRPSYPAGIYVGSYIDQFGVTLASSSGAAITQLTVTDGTFAQIGSNLTRPLHWFQFGYAIDDATMTNNTLHVDVGIGDATNRKIVVQNAPVHTAAIETISWGINDGWGNGAIGDGIWVRAQGNTATDSNNSIAVYGVGG